MEETTTIRVYTVDRDRLARIQRTEATRNDGPWPSYADIIRMLLDDPSGEK